jgi:hypothetical protein
MYRRRFSNDLQKSVNHLVDSQSGFSPTGHSRDWSRFRKSTFKHIAGHDQLALGYSRSGLALAMTQESALHPRTWWREAFSSSPDPAERKLGGEGLSVLRPSSFVIRRPTKDLHS